jgi:hypothetical protein
LLGALWVDVRDLACFRRALLRLCCSNRSSHNLI